MTTSDKPVEVARVSCAICLKEVPVTEAIVPEAADYFVHFAAWSAMESGRASTQSPMMKSKNLDHEGFDTSLVRSLCACVTL
jgi:hypothetical protein